MTEMTGKAPVYYDPYRVEITEDPYPVYRALREEAPLYYNSEYDFYAVSQYADVQRGLSDHETFISGRGGILEFIKADAKYPAGFFIFNDPPVHTAYRAMLARIFSPKRLVSLEAMVRRLCVDCLTDLEGRNRFDFMADLGLQVPMRVISLLLGIPEQDQSRVRENIDAKLRPESGKPLDYSDDKYTGGDFREYIDWRAANPADDVMTELLTVEFKDETGNMRRLTRQEVLTFSDLLAGAGNETTAKLIGWSGKLLAEHPDQRRELVENPTLIPNAIEEILRYEPPATHIARYVNRDVQIHGQTVPRGSAILFLTGSANRDENYFEEPDRFDIHRQMRHRHLSFGAGIHTCLGAVLARLEGRVVLEELLKRIPEWQVEWSGVKLRPTSTVRGLDSLPVFRS